MPIITNREIKGVRDIPAAFSMIWFLSFYNGLFSFLNYYDTLARILGIIVCLLWLIRPKKYIYFLCAIPLIIFFPFVRLGFMFRFEDYWNIDFFMGILCIVMGILSLTTKQQVNKT